MWKSFFGGIHPYDGKDLAKAQPIEEMPLPTELSVPLSQHIGAPCQPTVKVGDMVKRGQPPCRGGGPEFAGCGGGAAGEASEQ